MRSVPVGAVVAAIVMFALGFVLFGLVDITRFMVGPIDPATAASVQGALGGMLHGINPTDPLTLGGTALLMAGVTLLACWLPARAATRVEVNQALLTE